MPSLTAEEQRLEEARSAKAPWRRWGPYVSERQWGTVREDYSANGDAWNFITHDQARSHAYRWGEDGIAGICDDHQHLCFALALWNGADPILKERMFGLTGKEGNHGEDVKEYYFYLDNVPSHAYMKYLYKYPQRAYPYSNLIEENRRRTRLDPEYELIDTGIFDDNRYFDVFVEYAKAAPEDVLVRIDAVNRGPDAAPLHILPHLWFRNHWSWFPGKEKPRIALERAGEKASVLKAAHRLVGTYWLYCEAPQEVLFTENESNNMRLYGVPNAAPYVKDAIHEYVVSGKKDAVNPEHFGSKAAIHYSRQIGAGETATIKLRLSNAGDLAEPFGAEFDAIFARRKQEADAFYERVTPFELSDDMRNVQRQAFAGMLWSKQYYYFNVERWLDGDPAGPPPPPQRQTGRDSEWRHLGASDVMSMPDKWEYPWFAAWDMAFHCIAFALIDPDFAKDQLLLLAREWYMHPNGQIPAYEWDFGDVNPPVHAWAALRVYQIEAENYGREDRQFLERIFHKLMINFTWWVNRKDSEGNNIFEGGFLGLDNIGAFDRNSGPAGGRLEQADGTSWMAMYCLNLFAVSLELAKADTVYEDLATKFFEHFVYIGAALNNIGGRATGLWDESAGFYFDMLQLPDGTTIPMKAYTFVGVIPVFATTVGDRDDIAAFHDFGNRLRWFIHNQPHLLRGLADMTHLGVNERFRLALVDSNKLGRILERVLDEDGMLSPHGVRSVSKRHATEPFVLDLNGQHFVLDYEPGNSTSGLFGGNSNWRGPVWFPLNYLLIEALQQHHYFLGNGFQVSDPAGSGDKVNLWEATTDLTSRLIKLFLKGPDGRRPVYNDYEKFQTDPHWRDLILFHEYFHADTGAGLGASHQTGWTGLVAKLIQQYAKYSSPGAEPDVPRKAAAPG
ncbi:MAG: glucosidase [Methylobacteriaceae bacterium]|nr:glucosidase [Methylobacteriaceae bacterium]